MTRSSIITTNLLFERLYSELAQQLLSTNAVKRGPAHAMNDDTTSYTHEAMHITQMFQVDTEISAWQATVNPNLPWAEDHFQERISGVPMNPSPSEQWWPYARKGNEEHKKDEVFSHTYPERFWPKRAGLPEEECPYPALCEIEEHRDHWGIRFQYGDLSNAISILKKNFRSRQAHVPIWFPEDLQAADQGERVPCSLGYHFIWNPKMGALDCVYTLRSCDLVRFFRDDMYMAGRLLQHVAQKVGMGVGLLVVHIDNLHCFPGDRPYLESLAAPKYNFGSLL